MDPLAELVKIDAKSIGVGQSQHDVDQTLLKKSLDQTVERCVNMVGVTLNTASRPLLTYISGLGPALAQNLSLIHILSSLLSVITASKQLSPGCTPCSVSCTVKGRYPPKCSCTLLP